MDNPEQTEQTREEILDGLLSSIGAALGYLGGEFLGGFKDGFDLGDMNVADFLNLDAPEIPQPPLEKIGFNPVINEYGADAFLCATLRVGEIRAAVREEIAWAIASFAHVFAEEYRAHVEQDEQSTFDAEFVRSLTHARDMFRSEVVNSVNERG